MDFDVRRQWRDFICNSASGGRLLAGIGAAVSLSQYGGLPPSEVQPFLRALRSRSDDLRVLASVVDLLNIAYLEYFTKDIHRLLDHLSVEIVKNESLVGPALRGNPRWDRTLVARRVGVLQPGRYYSRLPQRSFARPENLLLKWLVTDILNELHYLERQLGVDGLPTQLRSLYTKVEAANRAYGLNDINAPRGLAPEMVSAAHLCRSLEYRKAADLAGRRNQLKKEVNVGKWKALLSLIAGGWLEPISVDDLFELYALALCLDVLANELGYGEPSELGLVIRHRNYVAKFIKNNSPSVEVFFDQSPETTIRVKGRYSEVLRAHSGLSGSPRRPDITIVSTDTDGKRRILFVEVKHTQSRDYLSESVYKAFGYIHDYSAVWHYDNRAPKVVLLVPDSVFLRPNAVSDVVVVASNNRFSFADAIRTAIHGFSSRTFSSPASHSICD